MSSLHQKLSFIKIESLRPRGANYKLVLFQKQTYLKINLFLGIYTARRTLYRKVSSRRTTSLGYKHILFGP